MNQHKGYDENIVVRELAAIRTIRFPKTTTGKVIMILDDDRYKSEIGHSTKGKIQFLIKYCNYELKLVKEFDEPFDKKKKHEILKK